MGYIQAVLSEEQIKPIKDEIKSILDNKYNNTEKFNYILAGNIDKEYKLSKCFKYVENMLLPVVHAYINTNDYKQSIDGEYNDLDICREDLSEIQLLNLWVNYQSKYEFNPPHTHSGVISFVLWVDIPYSIEDEKNNPNNKDCKSPLAGCFQFIYTNINNKPCQLSIPADKKYNNGLLVFPAKLQHAVYPFYTSDKYRISVAGNFGHKLND
jgi:hypothetical protein